MKIFKYEIKHDTGYRLSVNKSNLIYFKKIVYDGFNIKYSDPYSMEYEIDTQLIRKLKLKKIGKETSRIENSILELLERSTEREIETNKFNSYYGRYSYSANWSCSNSYYDNIDIEEKTERKERNKYQSKIYSQKAKQYENKARFRK